MTAMANLLQTQVTPYWETHYTFGSESVRNMKHLSPASINLLIINTGVPMLFAYGRHTMKLEVKSAGDSQALIQLKREYCDKRDCLRCRIGYEYLKKVNSEK